MDFQALSEIEFEYHAGSDSGMDLVMFGLSTCGFCKKALAFLQDRGIAFSYVFVDQLKPEDKQKIRAYVSSAFDTSISYPFLVIDKSRWISGFLRIEWERLFTA